MPTKSQNADKVVKAASKLEPRIAKIFRDAVAHVRDSVSLRALAAALERGDVAAALKILDADLLASGLRGTGQTDNLKSGLTATFAGGAAAGAEALPKSAFVQIRFDILNPRAVSFLNMYEATLIREVTNETRKAIIAVVRDGYVKGLPPRNQAMVIRESIGLTEKQSRALVNFRRQLEERTNAPGGQSMQPAGGRRLSAPERAQAARQVRVGGMSKAQINKLVGRYRQRLVNLRANTIARTETIRAANAGQQETWRQAVEQGLIGENEIRRRWITAGDERVRETHRMIPGMNQGGVGLEENFKTPEGPVRHPPLGPNCRCAVSMSARRE